MERSHRPPDALASIARVVLALTLIGIAASKLRAVAGPAAPDPHTLAELLRTRSALGAALGCELSIGTLLLFPATAELGIRAAQVWLAALCGVVVAVSISDGPTAPCGCFGGIEPGMATRAALLVGMALFVGVAGSRATNESTVL